MTSVCRERCDVLRGGDDPETEEPNAEERRSRGRVAAGRRRQESQEEEEVEDLCVWKAAGSCCRLYVFLWAPDCMTSDTFSSEAEVCVFIIVFKRALGECVE